MQQAVEIIRQHLPAIPGCRNERDLVNENIGIGFCLEWDRCWSVGVSLSISLRSEGAEKEDAEGDLPARTINHRMPRIELSWSGTGRSIAESLASIALYQQVASLGALVEAALSRQNIASVKILCNCGHHNLEVPCPSLAVTCPTCGVIDGAPCTNTLLEKPSPMPHVARTDLARERAATLAKEGHKPKK